MDQQTANAQAVTRRHFFGRAGLGVGAMALSSMLRADRAAATDTPTSPMSPKPSMLPAKAKSVIYLHMAGSPSQLELFENKPALTKFHGQE
jgi:hypothetical protein